MLMCPHVVMVLLDQGQLILYALNETLGCLMVPSELFKVCLRCSTLLHREKHVGHAFQELKLPTHYVVKDFHIKPSKDLNDEHRAKVLSPLKSKLFFCCFEIIPVKILPLISCEIFHQGVVFLNGMSNHRGPCEMRSRGHIG